MPGPIQSGGGGPGSDTTAIHDNVAGEIKAVTDAAVTATDYFVYEDAEDGDNKKRDTVQGILDLVPASDWPAALAADNTTSGTNPEITNGDRIKGQDAAPASGNNGYALWLTGGSGDGAGGVGALVADLGYDESTWTLGLGAVHLQQAGDNVSHLASGNYSTIGGGYQNSATALHATVAGGEYNDATATSAAICGGKQNIVSSGYSFIGGGYLNTVSTQDYGSICGGSGNIAAGGYTHVGGGQNNEGHNTHDTVAGGYNNEIQASATGYGTIAGGRDNSITAFNYGTIGGGYSNLIDGTGQYATIAGGNNNRASASNATVGGGRDNSVLASYNTIAGGYNNVIGAGNSQYGTVGGGSGNGGIGDYVTVAGGKDNTGASYGTVGGGRSNTVAGTSYSVIAGGYNNNVDGNYCFIAGGEGNTATGVYAAIPGGKLNEAAGDYSIASGFYGRTDNDYEWSHGVYDSTRTFGSYDAGQTQGGTKTFARSSTDATATQVMIPSWTVPLSTVCRFFGSVTAYVAGGTGGTEGDCGAWEIEGTVYRKASGGAVLLASNVTAKGMNGLTTAAVALNVSGNDMQIQITGEADTNIIWAAHVMITESGVRAGT